eukprot:TRINITY_DN3153_c0_g1_i1.p1 TRINITY_DN3153_c0_g1~~TRINITY_DN3153_c0_g1_i1.p1  ORF type:complete len:278 (+),score=73.05 TRINITY_DN3153_c0_g1_i1:81-914(+)
MVFFSMLIFIFACLVHQGCSQTVGLKDSLELLFQQLDRNEDGRLHLSELQSWADDEAALLDREEVGIPEQLDLNGDGILTHEELLKDLATWDYIQEENERVRAKALEEKKFKVADANGDGRLDGDEIITMYGQNVKERMAEVIAESSLNFKDSDKNGKLSYEELWWDPIHQEEVEDAGRDHKATFKSLDKDGDGLLTLQEFTKWETGKFFWEESAEQTLNVADRDKDGYVSLKELQAAWDDIEQQGVHLHLVGLMEKSLGRLEHAKKEELLKSVQEL